MDYKNFIFRFIISLILFAFYLLVVNNNKYLLFFGCLIYFVIFIEIFYNFKIKLILTTIYVLFSFLSFSYYVLYYYEIYYFSLVVFTIIIFDTSSYIVGSIFGKTYLFKKISPKKTLEGLIGGILFSNLFFLIYSLVIKNNEDFYFIFLINSFIISSFIGDLVQSYFKRINSLKDSSYFLPGHGGFFDRFDSFILTIYFLLFYGLFIQ